MTAQKIVFGSLPDGDEFQPIFNEPILVVLQVNSEKPEWAPPGYVREWAAYFGPESKGEEWVRNYGDKVNEDFARVLFPRLSGGYRR
jgi:hypothetical protein